MSEDPRSPGSEHQKHSKPDRSERQEHSRSGRSERQEDPKSDRSERQEAFWSLVVGLPAALSVLRLWVESGGDLQVMLLLVSNVGPLNLVAALFATITQLITAVLIALFVSGAILRAAAKVAPEQSRLRRYTPLAVRISTFTRPWFIVAVFILALLTWRILYLPLLVPAAVAVFQRAPWRLHDHWQVAIGIYVAALACYGWLIGPAMAQAWKDGEQAVVWLLVLPPLVALGVAGSTPHWFARIFAVTSLLAIIGLAALVFQSTVSTPILPLVVIETTTATGTDASEADKSGFVRGHIVTVNDLHLVILQELGGVRYIPIGEVKSTVLCGTPQELPIFTARVRGFHVEDSLLTAIGREGRPRVTIDPICRIAANPASN